MVLRVCFCCDDSCSLDLQDCMYLHELGDGAGSFTKDEMQAGLVFSVCICVL